MTADSSTAATLTARGVSREVHLEDLLGRRVRDAAGEKVGRIEEVVAEVRGTDVIVIEVHLGPGAWLERVIVFAGNIPPLGPLGRLAGTRYRVPVKALDLGDPDHPRLLSRKADLERL